MARKAGRATTPKELRSWRWKQLTNEGRKQIRTDFGGKDAHLVLNNLVRRSIKSLTTEKQIADVAALLHTQLVSAVKGCRDRTGSKFDEMDRRVVAYGVALKENMMQSLEAYADLVDGEK